VFHSVPDLIAAIDEYLAARNEDPTQFIWTASVEDILAKISRARAALQPQMNCQLKYETLH
jgi:hypothetical protein